jgi:16S rRNA (uracil1498-N3)-methyltransferase
LKSEAMGVLVEKATELGVTHMQFILTDYGQRSRLSDKKLVQTSIDAAQQCERLDIPEILQPIELSRFIENLPPVQWYAGIERKDDSKYLRECIGDLTQDLGFIIGPEGGWHGREVIALSSHKGIIPFTFGESILRAETAAITCLSQALV